MVEKYWPRLIPDDVAMRAQVVFATDYDALAAELADAKWAANEATARQNQADTTLADLIPRGMKAEARVKELEAALRRIVTYAGDPTSVGIARKALTPEETEGKE